MQITNCSSSFDPNHTYMIITNNYTSKQWHKHINNSTIRKCWIWGFAKIAYDRAGSCLSGLWNSSVWLLLCNLDFPVLWYNLFTIRSHWHLSNQAPLLALWYHIYPWWVWVKLCHHKNPALGTPSRYQLFGFSFIWGRNHAGNSKIVPTRAWPWTAQLKLSIFNF